MRIDLSIINVKLGFTRTQWLFIVCLAAIMLEAGMRIAENKKASPQPPAEKKTQITLPQQPLIEAELKQMDGESETNLVETNVAEQISLPEIADLSLSQLPKTNTASAQPGQKSSRKLYGTYDPIKKKVAWSVRPYPVNTNTPFITPPPPFGVRMAIP